MGKSDMERPRAHSTATPMNSIMYSLKSFHEITIILWIFFTVFFESDMISMISLIEKGPNF